MHNSNTNMTAPHTTGINSSLDLSIIHLDFYVYMYFEGLFRFLVQLDTFFLSQALFPVAIKKTLY